MLWRFSSLFVPPAKGGGMEIFMDKETSVYKEKLKRYYNSDGKLVQYPSKKPMRLIALMGIAGKMDFSKKYTEKEVNEIIKSSIEFSDIELVRREMYQYKFIGRLKDGSEYWAEESWREMYKQYAV
ncbi:MAG: DUF2087 domain-containing protein [Lachnospiraceae bacterium]|nr:DUF2087 domain-containing protein [Lachnospiraceae bacterium]